MTHALTPAAVADAILAGRDDALDDATMTRWLAGEVDVWDLMAAADRVRRLHPRAHRRHRRLYVTGAGPRQNRRPPF